MPGRTIQVHVGSVSTGQTAVTHGKQLTAANVGPRVALTTSPLTGLQRITQAWLDANNGGSNTISGLRFNGAGFNFGADAPAAGVKFVDCEFNGAGWANAGAYHNTAISGSAVPAGWLLSFEYCRWDQQQQVSTSMECGIYGGQWSTLRCEYKNGAGLNRDDYGDKTATETYVHDLYVPTGSAHYGCIDFIGGNNLTVERCRLDPVMTAGLTSCLATLAQGGGSTNVRIVDNVMAGGPYAFNGGTSTNLVTNGTFTGNIFNRDYARNSGDNGPWTGLDFWVNSTVSGSTWGPTGPYNVAGDPAEGAMVDAPAEPTAANTGPATGTTFTAVTGDYYPAAGETVSAMHISGSCHITNPNVTVIDTIIDGSINIDSPVAGTVIRRTKFGGLYVAGGHGSLTIDYCQGDSIDDTMMQFIDSTTATCTGLVMANSWFRMQEDYSRNLAATGNSDPHWEIIHMGGEQGFKINNCAFHMELLTAGDSQTLSHITATVALEKSWTPTNKFNSGDFSGNYIYSASGQANAMYLTAEATTTVNNNKFFTVSGVVVPEPTSVYTDTGNTIDGTPFSF